VPYRMALFSLILGDP